MHNASLPRVWGYLCEEFRVQENGMLLYRYNNGRIPVSLGNWYANHDEIFA